MMQKLHSSHSKNIPPFGEEGLKLFQQFNPFTQFKFPQGNMEPLLSTLFPIPMAPVANLPIRRVISATHVLTDLTLPYDKVVWDYMNHA